jgi:Integrase zinc binding domain
LATLQTVSNRFYWPAINKNIEDFTKSCDNCNRHKFNKQIKHVPLGTFNRHYEKMAFAHFDILGPYTPQSEEGSKYILMYIRAFPKYLLLERVPSKGYESSYTIAHERVN